MEQFPAILVVVDISGYTKFVSMHRTSMLHAEQVITELMEAMLDRRETPLVLDKLQGDAAFFYARDTGEPELAASIVRQVQAFFDAFERLEAELVSCVLCVCGACNDIDGLELKAIMHRGEAILKQVGGSAELAGPDIILTYRLMKNHVESDHYLLMTKAFHEQAGDVPGMEPHWATEQYDIETIDIAVFYPKPSDLPVPSPTIMQRISFFWRLESHMVRRMFLGAKPEREFRNIPD
jgi:hypothetical protein